MALKAPPPAFARADNGQFNFRRYVEQESFFETDPITQLPAISRVVDTTQESFAANATVTAVRVEDGQTFSFITGADGNYYLDLPDGTYAVTVFDAEGRSLVANSDPDNDQPTQTSYTIEIVAGDEVSDHTGFNFLLDPGNIPDQEVVVSGVVYSDINGDGLTNGDDAPQANFTVFWDENLNGVFDGLDVSQQTFDDPATAATDYGYKFTIPAQAGKRIQIVAVSPAGWAAINPVSGALEYFLQPGDTATGEFHLKPPADQGGGVGNNRPGFILGTVYSDFDGSGSRGPTERGLGGQVIYDDVNLNGVLDIGELSTTTLSNGSFAFSAVAPRTYNLRVDVQAPYQQTQPASGGVRVVSLLSGATVSGVLIGLQNLATRDFGDLPVAVARPAELPGNFGRKWRVAHHRLGDLSRRDGGRRTRRCALRRCDGRQRARRR